MIHLDELTVLMMRFIEERTDNYPEACIVFSDFISWVEKNQLIEISTDVGRNFVLRLMRAIAFMIKSGNADLDKLEATPAYEEHEKTFGEALMYLGKGVVDEPSKSNIPPFSDN